MDRLSTIGYRRKNTALRRSRSKEFRMCSAPPCRCSGSGSRCLSSFPASGRIPNSHYVQELPHQHQSRRAHSKDSHFHNTYAAQHSLFLHPSRRDPVLSKSTAGAVTENEKEKIHSSRNGKWLSIVKHSATELDAHYISDYPITSFFPSYYIL